MRKTDVINDYFDWLCDIVCENRFSEEVSYKKLLTQLHDTEFKCTLSMDDNRARDGIDLRGLYADVMNDPNIECYLEGPCSILEMMVALAIRCEQTIMDDPASGDRTGQWFWHMIGNLGLGSMKDSHYREAFVRDIVGRFLDRDYGPDGRGGLFYIRNCNTDLRKVEIWTQLCWYLVDFY